MSNYAMTGVAGFIACRHLDTIKELGHTLVAALDPHDSVGILDNYFPASAFFTSQDRFERHLFRVNASPNIEDRINYLVVCSPNHLHDSHIRMGLLAGLDVICEKPLVISPWNLEALKEVERQTGHRVYTVLQLRLLPTVQDLKNKLAELPPSEKADVELTYITRRGTWYQYSWKGDPEKSGGLVMNIGVHFFDLLIWLFGRVEKSVLHLHERDKASGVLELERAQVRWFLSIDYNDLPAGVQEAGQYAYRLLSINGVEFDLSHGFTNLHTQVYHNILDGKGVGIEDARPSIEAVHMVRTSAVNSPGATAHPFTKNLGAA